MRYGCCCCVFEREYDIDYLAKLELYRKLGFDGTDVLTNQLMEMSKQKRLDVKKKAADLGIKLVYNIGASSQDLSYSESEADQIRYEEDLKRKLQFISELGGDHADGSFIEPWPLRLPSDMSNKEIYIERAIPHLRSVLKTAEDTGVMMTLEVLNRFEGFMVNTVAEARKVIRLAESPNLKITLDVFHSHIEEDSLPQAVREAGELLGHIHLGEANRRFPGQGSQIDWPAFFGAVKSTGYDGMLLIESFITNGGAVGKNIGVWRDLSEGLDRAALEQQLQTSLAFVKQGYLESAVAGGNHSACVCRTEG